MHYMFIQFCPAILLAEPRTGPVDYFRRKEIEVHSTSFRFGGTLALTCSVDSNNSVTFHECICRCLGYHRSLRGILAWEVGIQKVAFES